MLRIHFIYSTLLVMNTLIELVKDESVHLLSRELLESLDQDAELRWSMEIDSKHLAKDGEPALRWKLKLKELRSKEITLFYVPLSDIFWGFSSFGMDRYMVEGLDPEAWKRTDIDAPREAKSELAENELGVHAAKAVSSIKKYAREWKECAQGVKDMGEKIAKCGATMWPDSFNFGLKINFQRHSHEGRKKMRISGSVEIVGQGQRQVTFSLALVPRWLQKIMVCIGNSQIRCWREAMEEDWQIQGKGATNHMRRMMDLVLRAAE